MRVYGLFCNIRVFATHEFGSILAAQRHMAALQCGRGPIKIDRPILPSLDFALPLLEFASITAALPFANTDVTNTYTRLRIMAQRLPWGLRKILRFIELHRTALIWPKPPFAGVYQSFEDIPDRAEITPEVAQRLAENQAYFVRERPKLDDANGMPILLPVVAAMIDSASETPLRILDFGGGVGVDFRHLP